MPQSSSHHATVLPTLRTFGALHMVGSPVTRPKPLLLLAYLAHEGPTDRERLARLFFGSSRDPRDALSTTLRRLGHLVEKAANMDERIRTRVTTDALEFERQAVSAEPHVALGRYGGAFIQGLPVRCDVELEDWIISTREHLGSIARDLCLELARRDLDDDRTEAAWHHTKTALGLTETFALEPEPAAQVLQRFDDTRLPVPDGWWRALVALGFDRTRDRTLAAALPVNDAAPLSSDRQRMRRVVRVGGRSSRTGGVRKPRRLTVRP